MVYSKQIFYCNCCGKECITTNEGMMGGSLLGWRVCSSKCIGEIRWKDTLSVMNVAYYSDPEPYKE